MMVIGVWWCHIVLRARRSFIANLAVGAANGQIKAGAPCRGECLTKYNQFFLLNHLCIVCAHMDHAIGLNSIFVCPEWSLQLCTSPLQPLKIEEELGIEGVYIGENSRTAASWLVTPWRHHRRHRGLDLFDLGLRRKRTSLAVLPLHELFGVVLPLHERRQLGALAGGSDHGCQRQLSSVADLFRYI